MGSCVCQVRFPLFVWDYGGPGPGQIGTPPQLKQAEQNMDGTPNTCVYVYILPCVFVFASKQ